MGYQRLIKMLNPQNNQRIILYLNQTLKPKPMKNITFALLLLAAVTALAQPTILSFSPHVICPGDTICVKLFDKEKIPFYFNVETQADSPVNILWWQEVYPTGQEPDTIVMCFAIPNYCPQGPAMIGINLESLILVTLECGPATSVKTALPEITSPLAEVYYTDLQGRRIEPRPREVMVKVIVTPTGIIRTKEAIND